jgi:uncharacterized metal-binding protein YceD (DUF177 family)
MSPTYNIPLSGLKEGLHTFDFEINKEFFEKFEGSEINEGELVAGITVEKRSTHADLRIKISGTVRIVCDRCLDMFDYPLSSENRILVKFATKSEEIDPDILYLPHGENELDLQQHIYEFIMLALPIRKIHPNDSDGKSKCNPAMLQKLNDLRAEEPESDPRWDQLKKLMNNN